MSTTMPKLFPAKSKEADQENDEQENMLENAEPVEEEKDLLQLVHDDNKEVAELFFQFSQAEEDDEKQELFDQIKAGLTLHAGLVEEVLYPLVPESVEEEDKEDAEKLVCEAEAGNYIASIILDELEVTEIDDDYFEAKMAILCGLVKEQVKREEKSMFDKLQMADLDFDELGVEYSDRKAEMEEEAQAPKTRAKGKSSNASNAKKGSTKAPAKSGRNANAKATKPKASAKKAPAKKAPAKKTPAKNSSKSSSKSTTKATAKKKTAKKSR